MPTKPSAPSEPTPGDDFERIETATGEADLSLDIGDIRTRLESIQDSLKDLIDKGAATAKSAVDAGAQSAIDGGVRLAGSIDETKARANDAIHTVEDYVVANPTRSILYALAAGMLLGRFSR